MRDDDGKRITLVHDRFQACCKDGCGFISGHQRKEDAIYAASMHHCGNVDVWDSMAHDKARDVVWSRTAAIAKDDREVRKC